MASTHHLRLIIAGFAACVLVACGGKPPATEPATVANSEAPPMADKLDIVDLQQGPGAAVAAGQKAVVQYTGWLYETSAPDKKGKEFDSSRNGGQPFTFTVGGGQVIKGWDQGVLGMKVGGKRRLTIPASLGYGDVGAGGVIPPGATLIFDVDLVAIE
jgi:FKBP-type peptidyl-prolyl cis-trans isomerase FkpA